MNKNNFRIVFMGTPDFAVASLEAILNSGINVAAVVTSPDKPSGRGLKMKSSAVKLFAQKHNIELLQPEKLNTPEFIDQLKKINADLFVVVAFRMLPASVWTIPAKGTINLHASLLPHYRGAAPINHAIINGESKSGVTTFFINEQIDTGKIIDYSEVEILPDETAGELHNKLMVTGGNLLCKTIETIINESVRPINQDNLLSKDIVLKTAPKIFKEFCLIDWNQPTISIYNKIRGLSPYPTAWTEIFSPDAQVFALKIFKVTNQVSKKSIPAGSILTDGKTHLSVATADGLIYIEELQLSGKTRMHISEFLRGFAINCHWKTKLL